MTIGMPATLSVSVGAAVALASATGSRQRLEGEIVRHALAEVLDEHGAVAVHD